jgi:hypothetical protein
MILISGTDQSCYAGEPLSVIYDAVWGHEHKAVARKGRGGGATETLLNQKHTYTVVRVVTPFLLLQ